MFDPPSIIATNDLKDWGVLPCWQLFPNDFWNFDSVLNMSRQTIFAACDKIQASSSKSR